MFVVASPRLPSNVNDAPVSMTREFVVKIVLLKGERAAANNECRRRDLTLKTDLLR